MLPKLILPPVWLVAQALSVWHLNAQTAATQPSVPPAVHEKVTVVTERSSTPLGDTARSVYDLPSKALRSYPAVTLDEALRQHAGFELFRRAPSRIANPTSEGISLRGLGSTAASRTLVLFDGAPLNDPFGGYIHWSEVPAPAIRSAVLVSGGGSDLYGSSALGGVIDILPEPGIPETVDLTGLGGSQSTSDLSALAAQSLRTLNLLAAGQSLRTGGYVVVDPLVAGKIDVPANVVSQSYRTEVGRRNFATRCLFGTANVLNETRSNGTPLQTNATRIWRYQAGYETTQQQRLTGRVHAFGADEGYRQTLSAISTDRNTESLTRQLRIHAQEAGVTSDATLRLGSFAAVLGADGRDLRATDLETPVLKGLPNGYSDVSARQRFIGGFAELLGSRGPWSGAASLRADNARNLSVVQTIATSSGVTQVQPADRAETVLSPRIGLIRTVGSSLALHASAFRAFRTPTISELYRTGQVGQETTLANASLLSERATGWELGEDLARNAFRLRATYFWTVINRPVSSVLVSETATSILDQRENLGQIRSRGVELTIETPHLTVGYQYADATVTKFSANTALVGNWIPQVPRQSLTAQLRAGDPHRVQLTLAARAGGRAYDDANNQFPLKGFFSLDLSAQRSISRRLTATLVLQNLTDQRSQVSRSPTLTLGTPLFVEAGLHLHLGKPVT